MRNTMNMNDRPKFLSVLNRTVSHQSCQRGVTMIEVLITVVILAIGLLGIAALQLTSKKSNFESVQRTTASMLAQGILEKMRANAGKVGEEAEAVAIYNPGQPLNVYAGTLEAPPAIIDGTGYNSTPPFACSSGTLCNSTQLASYDLWAFEQALIGASVTDATLTDKMGGLVAPAACIQSFVSSANTISRNGSPPRPSRAGRYRITIVWRGQTPLQESAANAANQCGRASGNYDGELAGDNAHRRLIVVDTIISQADY